MAEGKPIPSPLDFYPDLTDAEISKATKLTKKEKQLILDTIENFINAEPRPIVIAALGGTLAKILQIDSTDAGAPMSIKTVLKMFASLTSALEK